MRAKGPFVKTLVSVVALDNIFCIMLFVFAKTILADYFAEEGSGSVISAALFHTFWQFTGAFATGMVMGGISERLVALSQSP